MTRGQMRAGIAGVVALVLALIFPAITVAAPSQTARFTIITFNRVPVLNITEVGTLSLVLHGTNQHFTADWSFRGTTDGQPASASGTGDGHGNGNSLTLNLDTISQWSVPGFPEPETGKTAYLNRSRLALFFSSAYSLDLYDFPNFPHFIVSGVPILVVPGFAGPFARADTLLFESSFGGGATDITALPGANRPGPASFASYRSD